MRVLLFIAGFGLALAPGSALAQPVGLPAAETGSDAAADARVAAMIANERAVTEVAAPRAGCPAPVEGLHGTDDSEIVVCAGHRARDQQVHSSDDDADYKSRRARAGGTPHVGQSLVSNLPDCTEPGQRCRRVGRGHAPIYYIDTTKLPPPPPGSDAEKIANGEMVAP